MTDTERALLSSEFADDPKSLGLADMDNPTAAAKLNETGASSETVPSGIINGQELQMAVIVADYLALTDAERHGWLALVSAGDGQVNTGDQRVIDQATAIWAGTDTLVNLAALQSKSASRAEVLFGFGVTMFDVAEARNL